MTYKPTYNAIHKWLVYNYGSASKCDKCGRVNSKKYEYALIIGKKYEKNRNNFWQLCSSCHSIYDRRIDKLTKVKLKPVLAEKKDGTILKFYSIKEAVKLLRVSRTGISNNLNGRSASSGGLKWSYVNI